MYDMRRLLELLGIKQGKYSVMVKDTHQGKLPSTELKQPAFRSYKRLLDADKNGLHSYLRGSFLPRNNYNETSN